MSPHLQAACRCALLGLAAALAGCTLASKYQRPAPPISEAWPSGPAYTNASPATRAALPAAELGWREFFGDPRLLELIELSLTNNRDLRVAALNVEAARAQYRIVRSALLPAVGGSAGGLRERIPGSLIGPGIPAYAFTEYSVGVGVTSYELDLFGRVRSLKAQALNQFLATGQARLAAHIALVAEVAVQYFLQRELEEELAVAQQTLKAVQASHDLNQLSFDNGVASELDLRSAEAQVQTARANVAALAQDLAQAENALVLLVGRPLPAHLPPPLAWSAQRLVADVPAGLPAELLQRRPDLLAAEFKLRAAHANIGAARAAFFPKILLTGSAGKASLGLEELFAGASDAWSFGPQITVPIFDAGNNKAALDAARVQKRIEVANYEKAIQTAFREVADALAARSLIETRIQAQEGLVKAEAERYHLADLRYRNGVDSYLTVLVAQQDLYNAQQGLIQSRASRLTNLVTLYKTLGGGWLEHTPPLEAAK